MMSPVERSLTLLRQDAIERGFQELAIAYGWSIIELGADRLKSMTDEIASSRMAARK